MINKLKKNYSCTDLDLIIQNEKNNLKKCCSFIHLEELKKQDQEFKEKIKIYLKKTYNL
jgi:hypothetical protein